MSELNENENVLYIPNLKISDNSGKGSCIKKVDWDIALTFLEEKMVRMQIRELERDECLEDIEKDQSRFWGIFSCISERINDLEGKVKTQERMIEILMELVNEQRDTLQLIRYALED